MKAKFCCEKCGCTEVHEVEIRDRSFAPCIDTESAELDVTEMGGDGLVIRCVYSCRECEDVLPDVRNDDQLRAYILRQWNGPLWRTETMFCMSKVLWDKYLESPDDFEKDDRAPMVIAVFAAQLFEQQHWPSEEDPWDRECYSDEIHFFTRKLRALNNQDLVAAKSPTDIARLIEKLA